MSQEGAVLICVASGAGASALMQTLLANATPRAVSELSTTGLYGLVTGSYLLSSVLALPLFPQYADRLGPRPVLAAGHLCFCAGTLGLALAPSMPVLLLARVVQGLGAGAIVPAGLAALGLLLDGAGRGRALSHVGVVQVVANLVGWVAD
nr:MFS transporter [Actinomyces wuliandei]